jgi:N-acetylneuraminic acid mutarotase
MQKQKSVPSKKTSQHSKKLNKPLLTLFRVGQSMLLLFALGLVACDDEIEYPIQWTRMSDFPGTPRASATAFSMGQKAYVCFGRSDSYNTGLLNDVWEYDASNDSWTRKSDFPGRARVRAVAGVINGKAYVGLGAKGAYASTNVFKDWWEYDPSIDQWTQKASLPDSASNDLSAVVINDRVYTTMGFDGLVYCNETYCYDPSTDRWTELATAPSCYIGKASFAIGDYFYVGSGFRGYNVPLFYRYNTTNNTWKRIANLPKGRILSNGISVAGKGFVMLGRFWNGEENNGRLLSDVVEYHPSSDTWTSRGDFAGGARQNAVTFVIDSVGYVLLGETNTERLRDVWSFIP